MLSGSLYAIDCTASGICSQPNTFEEYRNQVEAFGEAQWEWSLGLGDSEKLVGLTITGLFEETQLPFGDRNSSEQKNLFSNYYLGLHLSGTLAKTLLCELVSKT